MLAFKGLFSYGAVHRNAKMTEMKRSEIEVGFAYADNAKEAESAKMTEDTILIERGRCDA